ncbi:DNA-binding protein SMUBP-2-like [Amphibalanus amphitrite]|uniref:DNA-binding protein SMUBP-2-like n=1 Tax=Amphibalanus amphitrite TaxID=1232801 RepID=UPI001C928590|nr:DNA-binding protein SMUBP-2-like [Amphibalanus amphitrite]
MEDGGWTVVQRRRKRIQTSAGDARTSKSTDPKKNEPHNGSNSSKGFRSTKSQPDPKARLVAGKNPTAASSRGIRCAVCGDFSCIAQLSPREVLLRLPPAGPSQPESSVSEKSPSSPLTCEELKRLHLPLLDLEHGAELARHMEMAEFGQLKDLLVDGTEVTPHGLRLWVLRPADGTGNGPGAAAVDERLLPKHNIRAREPIEVTRDKEDREELDAESQRAVVYRVTDYEIMIVIEKGGKLTQGNTVSIKRVDEDRMYWMMRNIVRGLDGISGRALRLRAVLFGEWPVESADKLPAKLVNANGKLDFYNVGLNQLQRDAVEFAVRQKHLAVIHGPPGTGKTTTIVEIILQHLKMGCRILACAHANTAVDNMLERLAEKNSLHSLDLRMVRLGHPARIRESLLDFWLDKVADSLDDGVSHHHGKKGSPSEAKALQKLVITKSKVVFCTLASTSGEGPLEAPGHLGLGAFDLVVIDECSQSMEAACWLAAQRTGKLLLAGDHRQLPPTIISKPAAQCGLEVSLMERQVELHGEKAVRMLCTQYRMHELIQQWPSQQHYDSRLEAAPAVRHHRLTDLPGVRLTVDTTPTLLLVDTAGCGLTEAKPDEAHSRSNPGEADIVVAHVEALVRAGVSQDQIGVITPYCAQITRVRDGLRLRRLKEVDVYTVDGFQGREKEAIVVSLVISKKSGLSFVTDTRRINVAITRARRQLVIVCDTKILGRDDDARSLLEYMRQNGEVRSPRYCRDGP